MASGGKFDMIENYIYLYHTDTWIILPAYPETLSDTMRATFNNSHPLSRSAPIYSYQHSGPRTVRVSLRLHRELMTQVNYERSNAVVGVNDDYVDTMMKQIQSIALPRYSSSTKLIDPPMVAVRFGNELFCKGIVNDGVSVDYAPPILENNKYAIVNFSFEVSEVDPYDADIVAQVGSYRGLNTTLERNTYMSQGRVGSSGKVSTIV